MKKFNEWLAIRENYDVPEMTPGGDSHAMPLAQAQTPSPTGIIQKMSLPAMLKRRVIQMIDELSALKEDGKQVPPQRIVQMLAQITQELMADTNLTQAGYRKAGRIATNNV